MVEHMDIADLADKVTYKVALQGGQARMKEAILFVCERSSNFEFFGLVKLNKILWRADFQSFRERQIPVTGRQYQRQPQGPVAVDMPPLLNEMLGAGLLKWGETNVPNERRPVALASPVMRWFSPDDVRYLSEAIDHYRDLTATDASERSHGTAWDVRQDGDPMPYEAALLSDEGLPDETEQKLLQLAVKKGWRSH